MIHYKDAVLNCDWFTTYLNYNSLCTFKTHIKKPIIAQTHRETWDVSFLSFSPLRRRQGCKHHTRTAVCGSTWQQKPFRWCDL